ncbi:MAG: cytochrome ubiquinol oxidase subunit I [Lysobacter sp.]|nr:cytochrome ubiquinol oxidase subunit I [Lysobacter sp.]
MDALLLSRIQFGFVISFHILFPSFTIGLASWLAFLEWRWLRTKDGMWLELYKFWLKIFAVSFGMGVVSGIVMSFQFGTNWSILSERAGNILGPLLSYEVLTAFFLEATFLGVMLFGLKRVKPQLHFVATCMVALGTLLSTFWIIAANSWMQTPQGHVIDAQGVFQPVDWWAIIFNPSFPYRLAHMVLAAFITTCFVIGGVSAWYLRRGAHVEEAKRMLRLAVLFAAIAVPAQVFVGDQHGLNMGEHQPAKLAAVEGHWREEPGGVPLVIFGVPNSAEQHNDYEIAVPKLGSVVLTHSLDGQIKPLVAFRPEDRPPVAPVFYAFRVMVGVGTLMLLLTLVSLFALRRRWLFESTWLLRGWNWMLPAGFIAMLSGWWVAEIGRQPWVVYGALRTAHALTPTLAPATVLTSLITFAVVYAIVFGAGIWYLTRLVIKGPAPFEPAPDTEAGDKTPARPLSVGNKEAV